MISKNNVPCKVIYYNQQTKQKTRLIGEIDEEKWFKFKENSGPITYQKIKSEEVRKYILIFANN